MAQSQSSLNGDGWSLSRCLYQNEIGVCIGISKIRKLGLDTNFQMIRSLYDEQDMVVKILAHRLVDGGAQQAEARKSFAHEKGCQVQFLVEWARFHCPSRPPENP